MNVKYCHSWFSTFIYVHRVGLKIADGSVLFAYLALVSSNDLKYFEGTQGNNKKSENTDSDREKKPVAIIVYPKS